MLVASMDAIPVTHDRKTFDGQDDDASGLEFEFYRMQRHHPQSQARLHGLFDRLIAVEFASQAAI